ncbi:MAG TPA: hypothetical protein VMV15_01195 [Candidatus Binataceae bacterium]|nr:hypothetical protein [Candidatus Binataceae bacterium]
MKHSRARIILDGVISGVCGAAVIALWFLLLDAVRGQPLQTPALLAASLIPGLHHAALTGTVAWTLVAEYTALHFLTFIAIGIAGAFMIEAAARDRALFPSLLLFVFAFEVFFIAVVMLLGPSAVAVMPWWKVMIGNGLATAAMLAVFLWRQPSLLDSLLGPWVGVMNEGIIAGIIGAVILSAWFLIIDFALGEPLRTPSILGTVILGGAGGSAISLPMVVGYTALHFIAFIAFGVAASILVFGSEREPLLALGVLILFLWFEVLFLGFVTVLNAAALEQLGWWRIIAGNLLALAAMVGYFEYGHPRIIPRIAQRWSDLAAENATNGRRMGGPQRAAR